MSLKIKFAVFVKTDISDTVKWYNQAKKGLGKAFLKTLKKQLLYIKENPEASQIKYLDVRVSVLKTYPYTIHYQYFENKKLIYVFGIFHTSLNPNKWQYRLDQS